MSFELIFFNSEIYAVPNIDYAIAATEGQNKKGVLILCTEYSNQELRGFLAKILQAVNTSLVEDVYVLDSPVDKFPSWSTLNKEIEFKKVMIFGMEAADLGLHINLPFYQCTQFKDCLILLADSLEAIHADANKKKALWRELQVMFPNK